MRARRLLLPVVMVALTAAPALAAQCKVAAQISPEVQTVPETTNNIPTVVKMNGEPSKDESSYLWEQIDGPSVTLSDKIAAQPTFTAPSVDTSGTKLVFKLTVKGCSPEQTSAAITTINVTNVVQNQPPVAAATVSPDIIYEGMTVTLDGNASSDPDNGPSPLTYSWIQVGGPTVTLANVNTTGSIVSFAAPTVPYPSGASLTFGLTVSDGALTGYTEKIVNVLWLNDPPVASLSCPPTVNEGATVTLDGSASTDSDDGIATYAWTQLLGVPNATLPDPATDASISFAAPSLTSTYDTMTFRLTVTDNGGLSNAAECAVKVLDVTPPVISGTANLTVEATSAAGAVVTFSPTAVDNVDGTVAVTCVPTSGVTFSLGTTSVSCNAADNAGNTASSSFTVTIQDTTPPVIASHADVEAEATGPSGTMVSYTSPATSDAVDGPGTATCAPASGSTFALGTTAVTCNASDKAGNAAIATSFNVIVKDTTPPVIAAHEDVETEATGPSGATVAYTSPATSDIVDGVGTAACLPASGSTFALGTTSVTCNAKDAAGNAATATSFNVIVKDTTPPTISNVPSDIKTFATSASGAIVTYTNPTAADLVDGSVAVTCIPASGSTFALGTAIVGCSATDAHGNRASAGFNIAVVYNWAGFFSPINNDVVNKVKAGSAIPVKFSLGGNMGLDVFAAGYPISVTATNFDGVIAVNDITDLATVTAGGSSLTYDPLANQYIYVWKTDKSWTGSSRQLQVRLKDGTVHVANFTFAK